MIKGIKKGMEAVENSYGSNRRREIYVPDYDNGSEKMSVRILADGGEVRVHSLFGAKNWNDTAALEYISNTGRFWDFCIREHDVECPHCVEHYNSHTDKNKRYKKFQDKFILPVLVRPHKVVVPAKNGNPQKELDTEMRVGYLMVARSVITEIQQSLDDIREEVGDDPNDYLTFCDIKFWKTRAGSKNNIPMIKTQVTRNENPLTDDEKSLVCEFFNIDECTTATVQKAMYEEWEKDELEAVERLSKTKPNISNDEDEGDVPEQFSEDVKL